MVGGFVVVLAVEPAVVDTPERFVKIVSYDDCSMPISLIQSLTSSTPLVVFGHRDYASVYLHLNK